MSRRTTILEAAQQLLLHYGARKTTIADIAQAARVAVGSVYLEFPSKDAVIAALSGRHYRSILKAMEAWSSNDALSYTQRLRGMLNARLESVLALSSAGMHASELLHCPSRGVAMANRQFIEAERDLLVDLLRDATVAGEFDVPDPRGSARALYLAYSAFAPPQVFRFPEGEAVRMIESMHELILGGLVRRR